MSTKGQQPLTWTRRRAIGGGLAAAGSLFAPRALFAGGSHSVARTTFGDVRGFVEQGINVFRGIRYGTDTRDRRFMPPLSPERREGVSDAFEYGPAAPQDGTDERISEDCLFLNVWTPGVDNARRPVMFYIHGGAYSHGSGSSPLYDGKALASAGDVVVVTVNHRLNAFGYLYLRRFEDGRFPDSGNCGQLDLVLALEWVRDNIAAFGGDPERVLAFGQSGGGAKIATMMAMPAAAGLFQRAASMSGQQVTVSGPANATARARVYLDAIGVSPERIETLRTLPLDRLLAGLDAADPVLPYGSVYFGPVLDMRSLERHPFYPDAAPQSANIPMIIGNTHDETRAFLRGPKYQDLEWRDLPALLIPNMRVDIRPEYVVARYREWYPDYSPTQVFFAATTAARSWRAAIIEAEERAKQAGAGTFVYQLDWPSPLEPAMGAPHTFDIPLVFGTLAAPGSITGTGKDARAMSSILQKAFVAFVHSGSPDHDGIPPWRPYTLARRETLIVDLPPRMENDPRGAERRLFARVPYVQPGT
ncbi:MAG TPA: carboxylesterase/lipase family protein [Woeseiaceae bacterium]|nr:carboxylesterase/lipase family protein [Woeseiaceae bacterium]